MSTEIELETRIFQQDILQMTTEIVASYVGSNLMSPQEIPSVIDTVFQAMSRCAANRGLAGSRKPAVPVKSSIHPDHIICLEDGKKLKMLKRYLRTNYNMTPEEYRVKWNLPATYPMVAPNYAKRRSDFAKKIGLGHARAKKARKTASA